MKLSPGTRSFCSPGACYPEYMALCIGLGMTAPSLVSIWLMWHQTALRLQPEAGEAHRALGTYYYYGFRDYARARSELAVARRTLPNDAEIFLYTGLIDRREGHWDDSTRNLERALELDPRNLFTLQQLAVSYLSQRRYQDAIRIDDRLDDSPGDPLTRITRAQIILHWKADIKPYQATLATLVAENTRIAPDVDYPDYALCERTAAAAARALTNYPRDGVTTDYGVNCPRAYWEGVVARWQGDSAKAQAAFMRRSERAREAFGEAARLRGRYQPFGSDRCRSWEERRCPPRGSSRVRIAAHFQGCY